MNTPLPVEPSGPTPPAGRFGRMMARTMRALLHGLLRGYQLFISPWMVPRCRFYPTCSNYALEAIESHGAAKGSLLAIKRLLKCHPWHPGGVDVVPPKKPHSSTTACGCNHF